MRLLVAAILVALAVFFITKTASGHRLAGHPKTLEARLHLAKRQVAHDRHALAGLHRYQWRILSPLPLVAVVHMAMLARDVAYAGLLQRRLNYLASPAAVICAVFGPYCSQALAVARCESRLDVNARNGQYLGLFQMGVFARGRYGHGSDAWSQARAAYRYFVDSGRGWGPWECKP